MFKKIKYTILFACKILFAGQLFAQQTEIQYLSGTGKDKTVNWEFYCTAGIQSGKWTSIAVPSCWELQGFGKYDYGFAKDSVRGKEQGLYKYHFNVPLGWKQKKINIVFEGVMTDAEVTINGVSAGEMHQGAFYSFKYDISKLIKYDAANLLEVIVSKHSANGSVNAAERKADFWLFGGIFRPVFLEALPAQHIERVAIDAKANGTFNANVFTNGTADKLSVQLFSSNGLKFGKELVENRVDKQNQLNGIFTAPKLWNAESPNLYKAVFTLYKNGQPVHIVSQKFGFRTVEVKQRDGIYVNGVKVKMKGVNRHSFWPSSGRTTSVGLSIEDVLLMKDMNMNAVRMSHYPPDAHFLETCDSLGLYVMDELAGWHGNYNTVTGTKLVKEMLDHDVNHPSIIFWSNGNEGGHNRELDHLFTEQDPQKRPVIHPWELFGGFDTQHYREYNYGIGGYDMGHDIIMPTEFLHGLYDGGHGAGLEDYWEAMWKNPLSAGGFLWDLADEGVVRTDKDGMIDTDGNHGADGIVGPYHEKEGSYFTIKEVWSPVFVEKKEITPAFDGKINIENRYHFTNTNQCSFSWKLKEFNKGKEISGSIASPDIKPLLKGSLKLNLPGDFAAYDVLYVTAKDDHQKEIFTWSFPVSLPAKIADAKVVKNGAGDVKLEEKDSLFVIVSGKLSVTLNRNNGRVVEVKNSKELIPFSNGPVLQEGANNFQNFSHHFEGKNLVIESAFDKKKNYNTLQWTIYPDGWIKMKVRYFPGEYFTNFDGVNFSFPEKNIKSVDYLGNGPYRVWKNRMRGNLFGIWHKEYNNTETGETWNYPEFKGYHSNMYWSKFNTTNGSFSVVTENEDVFMRLFTPGFKDDQWHNYQLIFPTGDISFMQGISGIGNKSQRVETTGPMGVKNIYYDYEKDPARAKELVLYFNFSGM
ncbi:MAG: glycoside hydrolase family 2 TIM barrel-domain containing protein [Bacteroidota bacterium]